MTIDIDTPGAVPASPAPQRLFFALWPNNAVRADLARAGGEAASNSGGRVVPADNLHLTLAFLGSMPVERMSTIYAVADGLKFAPFTLVLNRVEHWVRQSLLCAVVNRHPVQAEALVQALNQGLRPQGFILDSRALRAHVTLARDVVQRQSSTPIEPIEWLIDELALVRSETLPEGSRYTVLKRWPANTSP